jgi:hypothetical protein
MTIDDRNEHNFTSPIRINESQEALAKIQPLSGTGRNADANFESVKNKLDTINLRTGDSFRDEL